MVDYRITGFVAAASVAAVMAFSAGDAYAVTIESQDYTEMEGENGTLNDCAGVFGKPFDTCVDPNGSPVIAKYDWEENEWTINSFFSSVTGGLFTLNFTSETTGSWTYDQCATCPAITSYVIKTGAGFRWYYTDPTTGITSGSWDVSDLGRGQGLSHITFYDTLAPIPLPAAGWLLLGGLGALAAVRRRKKAA